jgi:hypothetical protein
MSMIRKIVRGNKKKEMTLQTVEDVHRDAKIFYAQ